VLQPNEFKIYNASAGAGKTYTLVKEYLSILLSSTSSNRFESILAITFTNKAANEMKQRILEQLVKFSKENYTENQDLKILSGELNIPIEELHERSQKVLTKVLHNYSRFSVSTIDKFNLRLMKSFAQDLGLSSNFNVEMDLNKLLEESVNQLFSKIGDDEVLTSVLIEIALDNLFENKSWDITREIIKQSSNLYSETHIEKIANLQKYNLEEFNQFRRTVYKKVAQKKNNLKSYAKQALDLVKQHGIAIEDFAYGSGGFLGFFIKFTQDKFEFPTSRHISFVENEDPKKYSAGKASALAKAEIPVIAPELISIFHQANKELSDLPIWEGIQKTIASLSIINEVEKVVDNIKGDNNVMLISEFNKIISTNLQEQPSGFIYERIGNRFHHYFIDEFQDTSTLQWQNLWPLIENARAGSDTVMLVGDAKQSIYRWRGGNPEQMIDLIHYKDQMDIQVENLPRNWRSYDQIIEFNNHFYTSIADYLNVESYKELYQTGNNQQTNPKKGGFVQLNFVPKTDGVEQYQADTLQQLVVNIQSILEQGFDYSEIVILHRTGNQGRIIAEFLSEHQIPIISAESLLLANSPEIQLIELFFKTISNEDDKVSKAEFLLKLHELNLLPSEDITAEIKSVLFGNILQMITYLKRFDLDLEFLIHPSVSLYDFTEKTISAFHLGKNGDAYLQFFLDYVLEFSSHNEYSLNRFLENWELQKEKLSISSPDNINAINLMTIHKSKGLEFPVVLLPFADWGDRMQPPNFWIPIETEELPFNEFMVSSFGELEQTSDEIRALIQKEKDEFLFDNLNMLYVATTRAVEQLYIITQKLEKENTSVANYFNQLFPGENEQILKGQKGRISPKENAEIQIKEIPLVVEKWEEKILISKESSKRWKKREEIVYGELVHDLMKNIKNETDIEKALNQSIIAGEITSEDLPGMEKLFKDILHHPSLNRFYQPDVKVLNERAFIDNDGNIYRPDRLVIEGNQCTIMDYKTGYKKEKDEIQVRNYAENLKNLGYEIPHIFVVYLHEEIEVDEIL
jgi:ATP-dependent exoDNAse (exonuclease V) beta subunit